jgi:hypothetical protein
MRRSVFEVQYSSFAAGLRPASKCKLAGRLAETLLPDHCTICPQLIAPLPCLVSFDIADQALVHKPWRPRTRMAVSLEQRPMPFVS